MKTGGTSTIKKAFFHCTRFALFLVPFKMEHFQSPLIIRDLYNYEGVPYEEKHCP